MSIRPLWDWVLVKDTKAPETTKSGLFLPNQDKENFGEVVSVGRGRKLDNGSVREPEVKTGDKIVFEQRAGIPVEVDGVTHLFMKEGAILAILPKT